MEAKRECLKSAITFKNAIKRYFDEMDANPWNTPTKYHDKQGNTVVVPTPRPYLLPGLCNHIGISVSHWHKLQNINSANYREDLVEVFAWANQAIYERNVTGAACDTYNHNIVTRIMGLTEKREVTTDMHLKVKEDAKKIMDKLLS